MQKCGRHNATFPRQLAIVCACKIMSPLGPVPSPASWVLHFAASGVALDM